MKKSVFMMCIAVCLASCSKNELSGGDTPPVIDPDGVLIQLSGSHKAVDVESTRVPYMGTISASNPLRARILTSTVTDDYSSANIHADGAMVFKGGSSVSAYDISTINPDKALFPSGSSTPLYMCGLYPYDNALENKWSIPVTTGKTATITFTGKEDVMAAAQHSTNVDDVAKGTYPHLVFNHLLTKLEFSVRANSEAAIGKWGKITGIRLAAIQGETPDNEVEVTLKSGNATFGGNPKSSIALYDMSKQNDGSLLYTNTAFTAHDIFVESTPFAYTMIAPFVSGGSTSADLTFEVTLSNYADPEEVEVNLNFGGYTPGRAFGITFVFSVEDDRIVASAEVIDWIFSGDVEAPVGD